MARVKRAAPAVF